MSGSWLLASVVVGALLFGIGACGFLLRRNLIVLFMCIELMLNGVNLTLVAFSRYQGSPDGQVVAALVMVLAASEAAVGLALLVLIFRHLRTLDVEAFTRLGEGSPAGSGGPVPDEASAE